MRFLVQAVNGVGVHSLDAAEGDGAAVTQANVVDTAGVNVLSGVPTAGSPLASPPTSRLPAASPSLGAR